MRTKQGSYPAHAPAKAARLKEDAPKPAARPSALVDTRVIYCGDNLEQLRKLPDACVDLIYIDPPFNSNRNYEVFWGETKEKRAFEDRHASTQAYIDFMRPRCGGCKETMTSLQSTLGGWLFLGVRMPHSALGFALRVAPIGEPRLNTR